MKTLFIKFVLFLTLVVSFTSCKKDPLYYNNECIEGSRRITKWGRFRIVDAVMYVRNMEQNTPVVKYEHFGVGKSTSSLRYGGSIYDIENIEQNKTTYDFYRPSGFPGYGRFILNGDTTKYYAVYYMGENSSIVEDPVQGKTQQLMGGSARPFSCKVLNTKENIIVMRIQEGYTNINGYNCKYWTQITLKKEAEW